MRLTVFFLGQGKEEKDLADNVLCAVCKKPGMKELHNFKPTEKEACQNLLRSTTNLHYCRDEAEVCVNLS